MITACVGQLGFQRDNKWLFSGSEDQTVKVWDLRAPGVQREYGSRAPVCTVVLHPNSGELISGAKDAVRMSFKPNICQGA